MLMMEPPRTCIDYEFMGDEDESMFMLARKDTISKMVESSVVESKGVGKFAKKLLVDLITMIGCKKIIFKSDNDYAICALKREFAK